MKLRHWSMWCAGVLAVGYALAQNPLPPAPHQAADDDQAARPEVPAFEDEFDRAAGLGDPAARQAGEFDGAGRRAPPPPANPDDASVRRRPPPRRQDAPEGTRRPAPRGQAREPFRGPGQPGPDEEFGPPDRGPRERGGEDRPEGERRPRPDEAGRYGRRPPENRPWRARLEELEQLRQRDPKMAELIWQDMELERACMELAEQYRRAGPDRREQIRAELTEQVQKHFEVRQQRRELEIARMAEQLERLRANLKRRAENKETLIGQRVAQLLGEDVIDF
ncbi:MAG: hypothetical protein K6T86_10035 [Pirellulales bacterium]|nr:hypothetical protein [Pirellulales bacterium]